MSWTLIVSTVKKFRKLKVTISQPSPCDFVAKGWFRSLRNWPSTWCDWFPIAITSSFQLWFMYCLKHWIADFPIFEMKYSMIEMDSRKYSNSVQQFLSSWILHVRVLSLLSLLAFMICFWKRITKLQSLDYSWKWASICFAMDYIMLSLILDCFGDKKNYQKHQNLTQFY